MVKVKVKQYIEGKLSSGTADSAPWVRLLGLLGHFPRRYDLTDRQRADLEASGVFDVEDDDGAPVRRRGEILTLIDRRAIGSIVKLRDRRSEA